MGLREVVLLTHLEGVVGEAVVGFAGLVEHDWGFWWNWIYSFVGEV
jgi:hypothetical protein